MDYDHTPPKFATDRHRDKANMAPRHVKPMVGCSSAADARASTYGRNPEPPARPPMGAQGYAIHGGRHGKTTKGGTGNPGSGPMKRSY